LDPALSFNDKDSLIYLSTLVFLTLLWVVLGLFSAVESAHRRDAIRRVSFEEAESEVETREGGGDLMTAFGKTWVEGGLGSVLLGAWTVVLHSTNGEFLVF
jgi:hypothetical protein